MVFLFPAYIKRIPWVEHMEANDGRRESQTKKIGSL
jgi:hypothetical protein